MWCQILPVVKSRMRRAESAARGALAAAPVAPEAPVAPAASAAFAAPAAIAAPASPADAAAPAAPAAPAGLAWPASFGLVSSAPAPGPPAGIAVCDSGAWAPLPAAASCAAAASAIRESGSKYGFVKDASSLSSKCCGDRVRAHGAAAGREPRSSCHGHGRYNMLSFCPPLRKGGPFAKGRPVCERAARPLRGRVEEDGAPWICCRAGSAAAGWAVFPGAAR